MASTATAVDDEQITEAAPEGLLTPPAVEPPAEPTAPPKRGRGRPPGSKNKPKLPGAPPPAPGRRPRTTARKPGVKTPTTEQKIVAAWGIPVTAAAVAGKILNSDAFKADALVLEHYAAGAGKILAPFVDSSPRFTALLDKLGTDAAPAVAAAMFGLSLGGQLAVNHGLIPASVVAALGAVPRDQVLRSAQPAPAAERQEPEQPLVPEPAAPAADPWAQGTLPAEWQ